MINEPADNARIDFINGLLGNNQIEILRQQKLIKEHEAEIEIIKNENIELGQIKTDLVDLDLHQKTTREESQHFNYVCSCCKCVCRSCKENHNYATCGCKVCRSKRECAR